MPATNFILNGQGHKSQSDFCSPTFFSNKKLVNGFKIS